MSLRGHVGFQYALENATAVVPYRVVFGVLVQELGSESQDFKCILSLSDLDTPHL
jgi:hypothetical protein